MASSRASTAACATSASTSTCSPTSRRRARSSKNGGWTTTRPDRTRASTGSHRWSSQHAPHRGITGTDSPYKRGQLGEQVTRDEIERIQTERPNDIESIERNRRRQELMEVFANGFERIGAALGELAERPDEAVFLGRAAEVVSSVGDEVTAWWKRQGAEAIDWAVRLPAFVGGVAALGWAGADMSVGTAAIAAMVGGEKVLRVFRSRKKKSS